MERNILEMNSGGSSDGYDQMPGTECDNILSDQAAACPKCGHPVRNVEYKFVTVVHNVVLNSYNGKTEYETLLKDGWQVVAARRVELTNDFGELYSWRWNYKLQR